jgi:hypothetical protein
MQVLVIQRRKKLLNKKMKKNIQKTRVKKEMINWQMLHIIIIRFLQINNSLLSEGRADSH